MGCLFPITCNVFLVKAQFARRRRRREPEAFVTRLRGVEGRNAAARDILVRMEAPHALVDNLVGFEEAINDDDWGLRVGARSQRTSVHSGRATAKGEGGHPACSASRHKTVTARAKLYCPGIRKLLSLHQSRRKDAIIR